MGYVVLVFEKQIPQLFIVCLMWPEKMSREETGEILSASIQRTQTL